MKTEINDKEAIGKKVNGFLYSAVAHQMILSFQDNTFTTFGIETGYDPGDGEIVNEPLEWFDFGHERLIASGIISEKEWESMWDKEVRTEREKREMTEQKHYLYLKSKYGKK